MNAWNLYRLANHDAEQMSMPMKRAALFLGFIQGPQVDKWVIRKTQNMVDQMNTGRAPTDETFWMEVAQAFQDNFQDLGARERVQEELHQLSFIPGQIDTFIAQFENLAGDANYPIDVQNILTLFAAKLPYKMMSHIILNIKPMTFRGWADAARAYHKDNVAVQNIAAIGEGPGWKKTQPSKKGFSAKQLAQILNVKLPIDPNAMDTRADRSRSFGRFKGSKGCATITTTNPKDKQRSEGRCYTCNKQGHISRNCPDRPAKAKAKAANTKESDSESETDQPVSAEQFYRQSRAMKEEDKIAIVRKAFLAEQGEEGEDADF